MVAPRTPSADEGLRKEKDLLVQEKDFTGCSFVRNLVTEVLL